MLGSKGKETEFEQFPCPYCQEVSKEKLFIKFIYRSYSITLVRIYINVAKQEKSRFKKYFGIDQKSFLN